MENMQPAVQAIVPDDEVAKRAAVEDPVEPTQADSAKRPREEETVTSMVAEDPNAQSSSGGRSVQKRLRKRVSADPDGESRSETTPMINGAVAVRWLSVEEDQTVITGQRMLLSKVDKAPQLQLSEDRLTISGDKGYRSVRATHGAREGTWFFEVSTAVLR